MASSGVIRTVNRRITEKRAAMAARQLLYHRRHIRWMEERMEENVAALETYLISQGRGAAVVPNGYAIAVVDDGEIIVQEPQARKEYEQLKIPDLLETEHD